MVPWGVVSTLVNILIGLAISYTHNKRLYLMAGVIILPIIGMTMQFTLSGPRGILLFAYYLTGAYNAPYVMLVALISSNVGGTTKKVVTNGIVWTAYCAGNIAGPFFFKEKEAPRYEMGIGVILGSFVIQCLMSLGMRLYFAWLNRQKDREQQAANSNVQEDSATHAFADLTDKEVNIMPMALTLSRAVLTNAAEPPLQIYLLSTRLKLAMGE